ncbi:MAG TPA: hypothetical protein VME43_31085 [Bryobacteraceae bacterium]|nr:hypothetical protein [Bryobacteraceae bacterium]
MTRFAELLRVLAEGGVEFVVVGGVAAAAHGSCSECRVVAQTVIMSTLVGLYLLHRALSSI